MLLLLASCKVPECHQASARLPPTHICQYGPWLGTQEEGLGEETVANEWCIQSSLPRVKASGDLNPAPLKLETTSCCPCHGWELPRSPLVEEMWDRRGASQTLSWKCLLTTFPGHFPRVSAEIFLFHTGSAQREHQKQEWTVSSWVA